ncbi:MAG: N-acetylglucosamine-6-sulfatase [Saprospiraceae bacterium]|nr:MAG: N-acetylglucosamine-6-sulfatase [Saprospiraceae bacterium]
MIKYFSLLLMALVCLGYQKEKPTSPTRPNIIFIMTDDHAYQAISAYESKLLQTPNIDRIAREGMRFDRAFVTNSICSPSRAVILTGKFSHLNGLRDNVQVFDSSQQTFPKLLQQAGYQTALFGKWHLKSTPTGFDNWQVLPGQGHYYNPDFRTPNGVVNKKGYVTDLVTDMTIGWLDSLRSDNKPFMVMCHHKAPHREWMPAQNHLTDFKDQPLPEPETLFDSYKNRGNAAKQAEMRISDHMGLTNDNKIKPEIATSLGKTSFMSWYDEAFQLNYQRMSDTEKAAWNAVYDPINQDFEKNTPSGDQLIRWKYQRYMQDYLACIKSVDENVGRLLDYLEKSGLAENTLVIYTSDQGFYLGEHGWFDKRFMYEESFRTPLLVRWPGKTKPGSVNTQLVQNLDLAETMLESAGVSIPADMQGKSLVPILTGASVPWRDALYYQYFEYPGIHAVKRHYGVRTDRYKLIHFYYDIDEWEMYDLESDPQEMNNIYDDPAYKKPRKKLLKKLDALQVQYQDSEALRQEILEHDLQRKE